MTKKLTKYDYKIADYCTRKKPRSIFTISRNMDNQNSAWYNFNDANKYIPVEPNFLPVFDTDDYLTTNCGTHNRRNSTTAIEKKSKKKRFDHERFKTFRKTRSANRIQDQAQLRSNSYYELSGFVEQTRTEVKNNKLQNCRGGQKKRHRQRRPVLMIKQVFTCGRDMLHTVLSITVHFLIFLFVPFIYILIFIHFFNGK